MRRRIHVCQTASCERQWKCGKHKGMHYVICVFVLHLCMCACMYTYTCVRLCMCTYTYVYEYMYVCNVCIYGCIMCTHTHNVCIHRHMRTFGGYVYVYIYILGDYTCLDNLRRRGSRGSRNRSSNSVIPCLGFRNTDRNTP